MGKKTIFQILRLFNLSEATCKNIINVLSPILVIEGSPNWIIHIFG